MQPALSVRSGRQVRRGIAKSINYLRERRTTTRPKDYYQKWSRGYTEQQEMKCQRVEKTDRSAIDNDSLSPEKLCLFSLAS
ncbi:hypothetical protein J6590_065490 [Homalodisca vitripennis]|nr:hypothetical protein J6590_065490 [Homalodisca vitripennis]